MKSKKRSRGSVTLKADSTLKDLGFRKQPVNLSH